VNNGRKHIAFVTIDVDVNQINARLAGYQQVLEQHTIFNENLILKLPFNQQEEDSMAQLKALFLAYPIDAVLFATNYLAITGLMVLKQISKEIGRNLEVIAYDDHVVFKLFTPQISAVEQPLEAIADKVIDLVLSRLSTKEKKPPQQVVFPAKLIMR
jgi:LacI family transcriptional regulator